MDAATNPLTKLPVELLNRIVRPLSTSDLCAVRLTCRSIERSLFHNFSHEFFRRKQFILSDFSLQTLIDISKHSVLSRKLQHVSFGLDRFGTAPIFGFDSEEKALWYHNASASHLGLISSGRAFEMLSEAFANLPNLKTVDIRDFNPPTRFRDFATSGQATLQYTGLRLSMASGQKSEYASAIFSLVLAALAKADARPENLEVLLRNRFTGLLDYCFDLTSRDQARLQRVLSGLRKLHVDVSFHSHVHDSLLMNDDIPNPAFQPKILAGPIFNNFLAKLDNVEWLRVNCQSAALAAGDVFLHHFAMPEAPSLPYQSLMSSPNAVPLENLRQLDLGHTAASSSSLLAMIKRIPSVRSLALQRVFLIDPANTDQPPTVWASFLRQLPGVSDLHAIAIAYASERRTESRPYPVTFDGLVLAKYEGPDIKTFLAQLADKTLCERPEGESEEDDSELDEFDINFGL